jgi:N-acetylglucosaminyldiphosphoundecaprenol N-acetyl-beta-D-mannosaminyltransferase
MKRAGLQWFHRFVQEPRRLWKRYLINNPKFMFNIFLQLIRQGFSSRANERKQTNTPD